MKKTAVLLYPQFNEYELSVSLSILMQAALAKECGVVRQTINSIENDKYDPTLELAFKIAKVLNSRIDEVFIYD